MHFNLLHDIHIYWTSPTFILPTIWRPKPFLGTFAKLRKATVSFAMSIRPFARLSLKQFDPPMDEFSWNLIFEYFSKICRGNSSFFTVWQKKTVTLYEDVSIVMIIRLSSNGKPNIRLRLTPCRVTSTTDKNINYSNIFSNIYSDKKCTSHMPTPLTSHKFARPSW